MKYINRKGILNKGILLSFSGIILGALLFSGGVQLIQQETSILHIFYCIAGLSICLISEVYLIHKIHDISEFIDTSEMEGIGEINPDFYKQTFQTKPVKKLIALYSLGIIAGIALMVFSISILKTESDTFSTLCTVIGVLIFCVSLGFLLTHILKSKHPEVYRRKEIESKDERNIIIRDKAGRKAFYFLASILVISHIVNRYFNVELDYDNLIMPFLLASLFMYYVLLKYYEKKV